MSGVGCGEAALGITRVPRCPPQEYVLSHTEMPSTLQGAEAAIKKQEEFMASMEASGERIQGLLAAGRKLLAEDPIHADKVREKVDSIESR